MYFEGNLKVDPSEITKIIKVEPKGNFRKLLYKVTLGSYSEKSEQETFTAFSVMQQLYKAFTNIGVNNIIRLRHDNIDFYLDEHGKEDDFNEAIESYKLELDPTMNEHWGKINLILEHSDENFKYLIEIYINRTHKIGEYPIEIKITGLLKEFKMSSANESNPRLKQVFSSQNSYDNFCTEKESQFKLFLNQIEFEIKKKINIDNTIQELKKRVPIHKSKIESSREIPRKREQDYAGVHYGYYGYDDFLLYTLLWSDFSHQNQIIYHDVMLENEYGDSYGHQDEFDTSDENYQENAESNDFNEHDNSSDDSSSDSWWGGSDGDSGGGDSSSCSSCGSCSD